MTTPSQQFCGGKRSNTPVGIYAASRVQRAILRGELVRPDVCSINDDECSGRIEGHHWHGYDEEHILDVQWLCVTHHRRLHGAEVAERNKARQTGGAGLFIPTVGVPALLTRSTAEQLKEIFESERSFDVALNQYRAAHELPMDLIIEERERCAKAMANVLANTPHPAEGDSPGLLVGITGRSLLLTPDGPRCAPIRAAGGWRGAE